MAEVTASKAVSKGIREWEMFSLALKYLDRIYLWGPPGLGKTYASIHSRRQSNDDRHPAVVNSTLSDDVVLQELMGHYMPKGGEFIWHDGPVSEAMRNGSLLVLNELARASSAVKDAMLGVLDTNGSCQIPLPSGEILMPAKGFQIVATANTDTDDLDPALADRFEAIVHVTIPHPGLIADLNKKMAGLGDAVDRSYADSPARAISARGAFTFAKLKAGGVDLKQAAQLAFRDRAADILATLKLAGV